MLCHASAQLSGLKVQASGTVIWRSIGACRCATQSEGIGRHQASVVSSPPGRSSVCSSRSSFPWRYITQVKQFTTDWSAYPISIGSVFGTELPPRLGAAAVALAAVEEFPSQAQVRFGCWLSAVLGVLYGPERRAGIKG